MSKCTTVKDAIVLNTVYDDKEFECNTQDLRTAISDRVADANNTGIAQGFAVATVYFIGLWVIKRIARAAFNLVSEYNAEELREIREKAYEESSEPVEEEHIC